MTLHVIAVPNQIASHDMVACLSRLPTANELTNQLANAGDISIAHSCSRRLLYTVAGTMQVYTYHSARYLHYVKHIHQRRALNSPPPSFLPASLPFLPPYLLDLASQFAYSDARTRRWLSAESKQKRPRNGGGMAARPKFKDLFAAMIGQFRPPYMRQ